MLIRIYMDNVNAANISNLLSRKGITDPFSAGARTCIHRSELSILDREQYSVEAVPLSDLYYPLSEIVTVGANEGSCILDR